MIILGLYYKWKGYVNIIFELNVMVFDVERIFFVKERGDFKNRNVCGIDYLIFYGFGGV